jgi:LPXTG-motif cell wall-anchored protein
MATTVVNSTPATGSSDNGTGFLLGVILLIAFVVLVLYFGLPYIQRGIGTGAGTQVNVPDHMNVNVKSSK